MIPRAPPMWLHKLRDPKYPECAQEYFQNDSREPPKSHPGYPLYGTLKVSPGYPQSNPIVPLKFQITDLRLHGAEDFSEKYTRPWYSVLQCELNNSERQRSRQTDIHSEIKGSSEVGAKKICNLVIFWATEKFQYSNFMSREFPELFAKQTFG